MPRGRSFDRDWIAARAPVRISTDSSDNQPATGQETGLIVLIQEDQAAALAPVERLAEQLVHDSLIAFISVIAVVVITWYFVVLRGQQASGMAGSGVSRMPRPTPSHERATVLAPPRSRDSSPTTRR